MKPRRRSIYWLVFVLLLSGCAGGNSGKVELCWGQHSLRDGDFIRPRAIAIDHRPDGDVLYVADFTGRIQAFDRDGRYLRGWSTPTIVNGRPAGLGMGLNGHVLVADSHYNQVLVYDGEGKLLQTIRGNPDVGPGAFAYVSDVVQDADGYFYVVEFGDSDRVQKFSPDGKYVKHWGTHGSEPGQMERPRGMALGPDGLLYLADSCNHRLQVFTREGELVRSWGEEGSAPGQLRYPYDVAINAKGEVYVVEFGNHRVQKFTPHGETLGTWGKAGRELGALNSPWGIGIDSAGRVHVVDTENHRVQRIDF